MKKIRTIIVDDELRARRVLRNLLHHNCPQVLVLDECESVIPAIESIKRHRPDLVFLDIQMPHYQGYELFNMIEQVDFDVIFVTAYDKYAIKAFELNALDYLTKPVDRERLKNAVAKSQERQEQRTMLKEYKELVTAFTSQEIKKITINELDGRKIIELDKIVCIEGMGAYSKIYFTDTTTMTVSKNLKYFQELLEDYSQFYRCHKSWIISLDKVTHYNRSKFTLTMQGENTLRFSRTKLKELEDLLINF